MPEPIVSDLLWTRIEPLLPEPRVKNRHRQYAGRTPTDARKILTGIVFALRTGVPWEHLNICLLPANGPQGKPACAGSASGSGLVCGRSCW
jgi:transposase